jgi:adenosylcobyric acid synthase
MSNYTDFEPLLADPNTCVEFVSSNIDLSGYECIILPGSKRVMQDLAWLKETGLFIQIQRHYEEEKIHLIGICGGYQMMFECIIDNECVEVQEPTTVNALRFIDDEIRFQKEKILKCDGDKYEIHHGTSQKYPNEYKSKNIYGTFSHGLFVDAWFKAYEKERITAFVEKMKAHLDSKRIVQSVL